MAYQRRQEAFTPPGRILPELQMDYDNPLLTREDSFAVLQTLGAERFLNMVAKGMLPVDIAHAIEVPPLHVMEWYASLEKRSVTAAEAAHAQSCVIRAQEALAQGAGGKPEADMRQAMADHLKWRAERAAPEVFGVPRNKVNNNAPLMQIIIENMLPREDPAFAKAAGRVIDVTALPPPSFPLAPAQALPAEDHEYEDALASPGEPLRAVKVRLA